MSSIERAKSFMQRKARLIALTAVPLASLVAITPAKAITITPLQLDNNNTDTCSVSAGGVGFVSGGTACTVAQNGQGIKMYGTGSVVASGSGNLQIDFAINGGTTNGGSISGQVPVSWNFMMSDTGGDNLSWTVAVDATVGGSPEVVFMDHVTNVTPGTIMGAVLTNALPPTTVTAYSLLFTVADPSGTPGETLSVSIPNGSTIDVDAAAGVPEPGTFGLLGLALAALGSLAWWRKRATSGQRRLNTAS